MRLLASWGALGEQRSSIAARSLRDPWSGLRNDRVGLDETTDRLPQAKVNMTVTAVNLKIRPMILKDSEGYCLRLMHAVTHTDHPIPASCAKNSPPSSMESQFDH